MSRSSMRSDIDSDTSRRTTSPKRRRLSSSSTASSRSSASSETEKSASRVTLNAAASAISICGKSPLKEMRDHRIERDEILALPEEHEAGKAFGHLHARESLLARFGVAYEHAEAQGEPRDVGEPLTGAEREGGEDGVDIAVEPLGELCPLGLVALGDAADDRCPRRPEPDAAPGSRCGIARRSARAPGRGSPTAPPPGLARPGERTPKPNAAWPMRPATRTMKNSSRLDEKIDANFRRSSSGTPRPPRARARGR